MSGVFGYRAGIAALAGALTLAACGRDAPTERPATLDATSSLEGDAELVAAAQSISDALGGCAPQRGSDHASRVVSMSDTTIVLIACRGGATSYTDRLFAMKTGQEPQLLALPDYGANGWFANLEAGMAELDAGTGVLTTLRVDGSNASCGSEARYQWTGETFAVEEIGWRACTDGSSGPPYPLIWPPQIGSTVDPELATPAP